MLFCVLKSEFNAHHLPLIFNKKVKFPLKEDVTVAEYNHDCYGLVALFRFSSDNIYLKLNSDLMKCHENTIHSVNCDAKGLLLRVQLLSNPMRSQTHQNKTNLFIIHQTVDNCQ